MLYYKAQAPDQGIFMYHISEDLIRSPLKYNLRGLINGVQYIIGVVVANEVGSSKISQLVSGLPTIIPEGFQNRDNNSTD